jgi:hypothetical protein
MKIGDLVIISVPTLPEMIGIYIGTKLEKHIGFRGGETQMEFFEILTEGCIKTFAPPLIRSISHEGR